MKYLSDSRRKTLPPLLCYSAAVLIWLVLCASLLLGDCAARSGGRLQQRAVPLNSLELVNLELQENGSLAALTADPQLIWINEADEVVRTVTLTAQFSGYIGEMCLYYVEQPGEAFGTNKRVFPHDNGDGSWTFTLPRSDVYALRLDPCSDACVMTGLSVAFNAPVPLWQYFTPSWRQLFWLLVLPGLAAAALDVAMDAAQALRRRTAK